MFLIIYPASIVLDTVWPDINSVPINVIVLKLTFVDTTIGTGQHTLSRLLAPDKLPNVRRAVRESFLAMALRLLIDPLSFVESTIWVSADSSTIHEVFNPAPLIFCAI